MARKIFIAVLALLVAPFALAEAPLPPQPGGLAWPTDGWEAGEMAPAVAAEVQPLIKRALAGHRHGLMGETRAVVIIHHGRLVAEAYRKGFTPETKQVSWSMAKSMTSALVGRAVQEGLIESIDDPMPGPFEADDPREKITWRQWITMTDGLDYHEDVGDEFADMDVARMMFGPGRYDVAAYVNENFPLAHAPGTAWNYSTAAFHMVGWALGTHLPAGDAANAAQAFAGWANDMLFAPLGMDAQPEFDTAGTFLGGSSVWASAHDYAKFGYLYLRDGVWDGERLLPEGWVDLSRSAASGSGVEFYGLGFWIGPGADVFSARGHEGQTIWIVPGKDLVIVRLGLMEESDANWGALFDWNSRIASAFPDESAG